MVLPVVGAAFGGALLMGIRSVKRRRSSKGGPASPEAQASLLKVPRVQLDFSNIKVSITKTKKKVTTTKQILRGVSGQAVPGRLLAIMGSSGGGKTSLLNVLAGHMDRTKGMRVTGTVKVAGVKSAKSKTKVAYVRQDEQFYSMLTVRETLDMAARLRLPASMPEADKSEYVESILKKLSLVKVADTRVGDNKTRGISGGERKRLGIAVELIGSPSLIFVDEPTTGLDSWQAEKVVRALKGLAEEGHTVVAVIHQPRASIYEMFDDMILVADGIAVYSGPRTGLPAHFAKTGADLALPEGAPPHEAAIDLVSIDYSTPEAEAESRGRIGRLAAASKESMRSGGREAAAAAPPAPAPPPKPLVGGWLTQFGILLSRSWKQVVRDKATSKVRMTTSVMSALLFGSIFFKLGRTQGSIQSRMGLLQVACINTAMTSLVKTIAVFPNESAIVRREREKQSYTIGPYFLAKLAAELPISSVFPLAFAGIVYPLTGLHRKWGRFFKFMGILTLESFTASSLGLALGALAPSGDAAMAIGPPSMVIFIIFGGYYVNAETIPKVLRGLPSISLIRWGFEATSINDFKGLIFDHSREGDAATGEQVLARLSFDKSTVSHACLQQAKILLVNYGLTYYILRKKRPQFQEVEAEEEE